MVKRHVQRGEVQPEQTTGTVKGGGDHGIKVFCVCCAISGIMLAYEVYCGNKDKKTDGTAVDVCDRLVIGSIDSFSGVSCGVFN